MLGEEPFTSLIVLVFRARDRFCASALGKEVETQRVLVAYTNLVVNQNPAGSRRVLASSGPGEPLCGQLKQSERLRPLVVIAPFAELSHRFISYKGYIKCRCIWPWEAVGINTNCKAANGKHAAEAS